MHTGIHRLSMAVGFYFNPIFLEHVDVHSPIHPESPERLTAIIEYLTLSDLNDHLAYKTPKRYGSYFIKSTHCEKYFQNIYDILSREKGGTIDFDTFFSSKTLKASLIAANTGMEACKAIASGEFNRAFCCIRPPGHHAVKDAPMGFCFFNNVAITANYLKFKGLNKVLIIDFDVHHGNGTQQLFYEDDSVLFISIHQSGIYPFNGFIYQHGMHSGEGFNLNFPLEADSTREDYLAIIAKLQPIIARFNPDALLFSAGFDAHKDDAIGELNLESVDYFTITKMMIESLPDQSIPIISHLEGGYNLKAIAESVYYHLKALNEV